MPELESLTVSVGKLFSQEYFFRIPEYQRPFSWDADNLSDLIDDLIGAPRQNDYFLGTLVLHAVDQDASLYDVVDGQQRLTALCILLACIRDSAALADDLDRRTQLQNMLSQQAQSLAGIPERNRLHVWDLGAFNRVVIEAGGTLNSPDIDLPIGNGEKRYRVAVEIFHTALAARSQDAVVELAEFIVQKCVVIYLAAKSFDDAFRLFTVINDRGKQLRRIDVLKANNLSPAVISDAGVRTQYAKKWEAMEEAIGSRHFEEIFSSLRLIYVQEKPQGDLLKEFTDRVFGKPGRPSLGTNFIDELTSYVKTYDALFLSRDYLEGNTDAAKFESLMAIMVAEFSASEWRACVLQFAKKFGRSDLYRFLLEIEKVFLEQWVNGIRKDERYVVYTDLLKAIEVARRPSDIFGLIEYDIEPVQSACKGANFYGAGYSKYLLMRAELVASELTESRTLAVRSVEHVLPQNPAADSEWRSVFSQEDIDQVVHQSGNLVLLSKGKNSAAGNREFDEKKATYLRPRVSDFPRSIQILDEAVWTRDLIEQRTEDFAAGVLSDL